MVRGGGPHRGEGPRYTSGNLYLLERHSMPLFSTPSLLPPFLLLRVFSFSLSSFLPWSVPLVPLALALSREGLYSPYFCVVITRRTDHGRIAS